MIIGLSVATYNALAVCIVVGTLAGFKRGLGRGVVRTVYLVLLIPIAGLLANLLATPIVNKVVSVVFDSGNMLIETAVGTPENSELLFEIVRVLIVPLMFAIVYGILEALSLIYFRHVSDGVLNKLVGDKQQHRLSRCFGGLLGFAQGAAVSVILLIPLCMATTTLAASDPVALAALNIPGVSAEAEAPTADTASPVAMVPSNRLLYSVTILDPDAIPHEYRELREGEICMMDEAPHIINACGHAKRSYSIAAESGKSKAISGIRALGALNSSMGRSRVLPAVLAHTMNATSDIMTLAQNLFGLNISGNSVATQLMDEIISTLKNADSSSISSILGTLAGDGYNSGTFENLLELSSKGAGESLKQNEHLIADVLINLGRNKDLSKVNNIVSTIATDLMDSSNTPLLSTELESSQKRQILEMICDALANYFKLTSSIDGADYEEQVKNLADIILTGTKSYNYEMTESVATIASVGIITYCENGGDITPEGIMTYIGLSQDEIAAILADTGSTND